MRRRSLLLFITVMFFINVCLCGQETEKPGNHYPYGISLKVNSILASGLAFDAFVTPRINLEISGAFFLTAGAELGLNFHITKEPMNWMIGRWSPYVGLHAGYYELHFLTRTNYSVINIPFGLQLLEKSRISAALEFGYSLQKTEDYRQGDLEPYKTDLYHRPFGSVLLGIRF